MAISVEIPYVSDGEMSATCEVTEISVDATDSRRRRIRIEVYLTSSLQHWVPVYVGVNTDGAVNKGTIGQGSGPVTIYSAIVDTVVQYGEDTASVPFWFHAEQDLAIDTQHAYYSIRTTKDESGNYLPLTISGLSIIHPSKIDVALDTEYGNKCHLEWVPTFASDGFGFYTINFYLNGRRIAIDNYDKNLKNLPRTEDGDRVIFEAVIPVDAAAYATNSEYGRVTATVKTYSDNSLQNIIGGEATASFNVRYKSNHMPQISCTSSIVYNNGWNIALTGVSKIVIDAQVAAQNLYGSRIQSVKIFGQSAVSSGEQSESYSDVIISYDNTSTSYIQYNGAEDMYTIHYENGDIMSSGTMALKISYTDSRGVTSQPQDILFGGSNSIQFVEYHKPIIYTASASKEKTGVGSNIKITIGANCSFSSVNGKNALKASITLSGQSGVITSKTGIKAENFTLDQFSGTSYTDEGSYTFRLKIEDSLGSIAEKDIFLASKTVLLDFKAGGNGLGIGGICSQNRLEVSMPTTFYNNDINIKVEEGEDIVYRTLIEYIRKTVRILDTSLYGTSFPPNPENGQIFFKRA